MDAAQGKAIVVMDADLQDPPEVVEQLIAKWKARPPVLGRHPGRRRRLPPDRPQGARRTAPDAGAGPLRARHDRLARLPADRSDFPSPRARRRRNQISTVQDGAARHERGARLFRRAVAAGDLVWARGVGPGAPLTRVVAGVVDEQPQPSGRGVVLDHRHPVAALRYAHADDRYRRTY